jgi:hypothetical protein
MPDIHRQLVGYNDLAGAEPAGCTVNAERTPISPLTDVSPLTFFPSTAVPPLNSFGCPVASGDNIEVWVTNPQSGNLGPSITTTVQTYTGP